MSNYEPTTKAGRVLLADIGHLSPKGAWSQEHDWEAAERHRYAQAIEAIEAEARKGVEAQLRECDDSFEEMEKAAYTEFDRNEQLKAQVSALREALRLLLTDATLSGAWGRAQAVYDDTAE